MSTEIPSDTGGLSPLYQHYERQKCFIGLSHGARWREEIVSTCDEVLPALGFNLEPWYADDYYDPTKPLLDIVVEMIANARYGIYDLSYWRKDDTSEWVMPRNVFIELGIAIALNRPTLLLQHEESRQEGPKLPESLESIRDRILPFTGNYTLKKALEERLPQWVNVPPEQEWRNRYCHFGDRSCLHREAHPRARHWMQGPLPCYISHGPDRDQHDFRDLIERVLKDYNDVEASYLNELSLGEGYEFLLCTHCQKVRSTPFTIHRITPVTSAEAFIAIGISIALETQFDYKIPKILLASKMEDVPSLLTAYKVVIARDNLERKKRLQEFLPHVYQSVRTMTWRSRPLPFIEIMPRQSERPAISQKTPEEIAAEEAYSLNEKGNVYFAERRYEEALVVYEQAAQLAPMMVQYQYNKALTLYSLKRYQEALEAYEQTIQIAPDNAAAYGGRGFAYAALQDYQAAMQSFDRALALDPTLDWVKAQREVVVRLLKENNVQSQPKDKVQLQSDVLAERYQLQDPIGRGDMATIYRGRDLRTDRIVAIKVLREAASTDPKYVTRFHREAKAASSLQHPNIVQVYDYGQSEGNYFIVMEYIEGTDLRRYIRSRGVLAVDRTVLIAHDIALGLGAAHRREIVHRDVKPANILIGRDGSIKLTDFGIASVYKDINDERLTPTGESLGTIQYYAPEQAQGEIVNPAADVYALGIVMYEMLTGRPPFDGNTPVAVAMQHIQDMPTPPSQLNPKIPPALEDIILRCLEKIPEMRYRNGSMLARELEQLGEKKPAIAGAQKPSIGSGSSASSPSDTNVAPASPQPTFYPNSGGENTQPSVNRTAEGKSAPPSLLERFTRNFNPFQARLQPAEIVRGLEREMENETLLQSEGRRLAPDVYDIYLSTRDYQQIAPSQDTLIRKWQGRLVEFARRRYFTLRTMPVICLHPDLSQRLGVVRIETEITEIHGRRNTQALSDEQVAQLRAQIAATGQPGLGGSAPNQPDATGPSTAQAQVNMPEAWFTIHLPEGGQRTYHIEKPIINIGRQLSNDIVIEDTRVSRYHAQIKFQSGGQFAIFDLDSTNGITINDMPHVRQHILRNGDRFTIGGHDFHFERR
jgi:serine/threonine protein kinase